jgi:hypothetical protein
VSSVVAVECILCRVPAVARVEWEMALGAEVVERGGGDAVWRPTARL